MKIRIVHTMRADWLKGVRIKTYIVSVLGTYIYSNKKIKILFLDYLYNYEYFIH